MSFEGFRRGESLRDSGKDWHVVACPFHFHSARSGEARILDYAHCHCTCSIEFGLEVTYQIDPGLLNVAPTAERLF